MAFESELNIVTISIIFGMIGILSSILFQLRSIRTEHTKALNQAIQDTVTEKAETAIVRREIKNDITNLNKRVDRLEAMIFRLPKESNPNSWY